MLGVGGGPDQALHISIGADVVVLGEGSAGIDARRPFARVLHGDDVLGQIVVAGDGEELACEAGVGLVFVAGPLLQDLFDLGT